MTIADIPPVPGPSNPIESEISNLTHPARPGPLGRFIDVEAVARFDETVEVFADQLRGNAVADRLFYTLSAVGDHGIVWHVINTSRVGLRKQTFGTAVENSVALGVEAAVVNGPIKWLFRRKRPIATEERPIKLRHPRTSSFPSGHSSSGIFAAMLLSRHTRRSWPWYVLGVAIGWSRVHVRIHHPSDVVGGYVVGWGLGKIALKVLAKTR